MTTLPGNCQYFSFFTSKLTSLTKPLSAAYIIYISLKAALENIDIYASIVQRIVMVAGIFGSAWFFLFKLEHQPRIEMSENLIGVENCSAFLQFKATNIGIVPFTLEKAYVVADDVSTSESGRADSINQKIASRETISILMKAPLPDDFKDRIVNFRLTAKIKEDDEKIWRRWDEPIHIKDISSAC